MTAPTFAVGQRVQAACDITEDMLLGGTDRSIAVAQGTEGTVKRIYGSGDTCDVLFEGYEDRWTYDADWLTPVPAPALAEPALVERIKTAINSAIEQKKANGRVTDIWDNGHMFGLMDALIIIDGVVRDQFVPPVSSSAAPPAWAVAQDAARADGVRLGSTEEDAHDR